MELFLEIQEIRPITLMLLLVVITIGFLIANLSFFYLLILSLLIFSILSLPLLVNVFLKINNITIPKLKIDIIVIGMINVLLGLITLAMVQSIIYFYFNFEQGYFFSFIFIFMAAGLYQVTKSSELVNTIDLRLFKLILALYIPYYLYAVIFDLFLLETYVFNPFIFALDLVTRVPIFLLANLSAYAGTNLFSTPFLVHLGTIILLYIVVFFGVWKVFSFIGNTSNESMSWKVKRNEGISLVPYIALISMVSFLSVGYGLTELYRIISWILIVFLLIILLIYSLKHDETNYTKVQFDLVLWLIMIFVSRYVNPIVLNLSFVQQTLLNNTSNGLILFVIAFAILPILVLVIFKSFLTSLSEIERKRFTNYCNFISLALLISYIPISTVQLTVLILLEFFASFYIFKWGQSNTPIIERNSINLNHSNNITFLSKLRLEKQVIIQKSTEITLFFLAYLIII